MPACLVCGETEWVPLPGVHEMMFGMRAEFSYGRCEACGSLQLLPPPDDMAPFYTDG
jgi:hypothetical protein